MARYIDIDRWLEKFDLFCEIRLLEKDEKYFPAWAIREQVQRYAHKYPADVRENVHGEWIYKKYRFGKDEEIGWFQCSACEHASWTKENNFCPNCGADMRSKNEQQE